MPTARRPNILFVLSDQHRGDWLGSDIEALRTPQLDRLAREGTRFTSAICPSPLCAPSRACMAMARDYDDVPVRTNAQDMPADAPTFYRALRDAGYQVLSCGKLDLFKEAGSWGRDGWHRQADGRSLLAEAGFTGGADSAGKHDAVMAARAGRDEPYGRFLAEHGLLDLHVDDYARRPTPNYRNCTPTPLPDFAYADNWVGASACRLLQQAREAGTPWFLQVNFLGPHEPMDVTEAMAERWAGVDLPMPDVAGDFSASEHREIRRRYAAMIETIDGWIGVFRRLLASSGQLEDTVIVYASDHGDMLGDHGLWAKLHPLQPSLGVPLIFSGPGIAVQTRTDPVSLIDLGPTFVAWAGGTMDAGAGGTPLQPLLAGGPGDAGAVRFAGFGAWRAVSDGRYKLIAGYDRARIGVPRAAPAFDAASLDRRGQLQLFDLAEDPQERLDLAPAHPEIVERLAAHLRARHRVGERSPATGAKEEELR